MSNALEVGLWETATLILRSASIMILLTATALGARAVWVWLSAGSAENSG